VIETPEMVRYNPDGTKTNQVKYLEWFGSMIDDGLRTGELDPEKSFAPENKEGKDSPLRQVATAAIIAHWNNLEQQEQITKD
jgi:hypothetical protein